MKNTEILKRQDELSEMVDKLLENEKKFYELLEEFKKRSKKKVTCKIV